MQHARLIFGSLAFLFNFAAVPARAQTHSEVLTQLPRQSGGTTAHKVDGVAARIEDDVITESELQELAAFQQLVDGKAKSRSEVIRMLADQWIVSGEARTAQYQRPSQADVDRAYSLFVSQFKSPDEFRARCAAAGLSEPALRRLLAQQLYLAHFIDFRFRPAAQISDQDVEAYYRTEFSPQLKSRSQEVPALADVEDTIREVLIQRAITERAAKWLDETRDHLRIDVVTDGGQP
jgi:hypothetical protein